MAHDLVKGDGLRTTYAFAPRVTVSVKRDGPTSLRLDFASSPVYRDGQEFRVTQLTFERVIAYGWNDFEFHRVPSNPLDVEFALIEIVDSSLISELRATGRPLSEDVRHYRICFDDHGSYDVVCGRLDISHGVAASESDELYP